MDVVKHKEDARQRRLKRLRIRAQLARNWLIREVAIQQGDFGFEDEPTPYKEKRESGATPWFDRREVEKPKAENVIQIRGAAW